MHWCCRWILASPRARNAMGLEPTGGSACLAPGAGSIWGTTGYDGPGVNGIANILWVGNNDQRRRRWASEKRREMGKPTSLRGWSQWACVHPLQSCPVVCDSVASSPPGPSLCGILQARILECIVMSSSGEPSRPGDQTHISCVSCIARGRSTTEPPGSSGRRRLANNDIGSSIFLFWLLTQHWHYTKNFASFNPYLKSMYYPPSPRENIETQRAFLRSHT